MLKVSEAVERISENFPESIQEDYDNTGVQVVFSDEIVKGIYICLDADIDTINDAIRNGCNLIISHHPVLFRSIRKIISDDAHSRSIIKLIDNRVSLFAMHTNFDKIMYYYLSERAGFDRGSVLIKQGYIDEHELGFGSLVSLKNKITLKELIETLKKNLDLDYVIYSGDLSANIESAAFLNGAGGGSIEKVISTSKPDCVVTGDVGYHHVKYALDNNVCVVDAGHFGTEIIFKKLLAECIKDIINVRDIAVNIVISSSEKNPFKVY